MSRFPFLRLQFVTMMLISALSAAELKFHKDLPVVIDTQVTNPDENDLTPPSPESPIHYNLVTSGYNAFGLSVVGDIAPKREAFIRHVATALAPHGYLPADADHPATKTIGLSWGSILDDFSASERYLSGQQHAIKWQTRPVIAQNRDYRPSFDWSDLDRTTYNRVLNVRGQDTYVVFLTLCDWDEETQTASAIDWQTRAMVPARHISAATALPKAVTTMAPVFGQHDTVPRVTVVSRKPDAEAPATSSLPRPPVIFAYSTAD